MKTLLELGDVVEIDGVRMHVGAVRNSFAGIRYDLWWLANGDLHEAQFPEEEIAFLIEDARKGGEP